MKKGIKKAAWVIQTAVETKNTATVAAAYGAALSPGVYVVVTTLAIPRFLPVVALFNFPDSVRVRAFRYIAGAVLYLVENKGFVWFDFGAWLA